MWGSAYNLPHDLYVYESDQMTAREVLDLEPQESSEREPQLYSQRFSSKLWAIIASFILAALVLVIVVALFSRPG